jgi:hypothetical protein
VFYKINAVAQQQRSVEKRKEPIGKLLLVVVAEHKQPEFEQLAEQVLDKVSNFGHWQLIRRQPKLRLLSIVLSFS